MKRTGALEPPDTQHTRSHTGYGTALSDGEYNTAARETTKNSGGDRGAGKEDIKEPPLKLHVPRPPPRNTHPLYYRNR